MADRHPPVDDTPEGDGDEHVPTDLTELHEILEWQRATEAQPPVGG